MELPSRPGRVTLTTDTGDCSSLSKVEDQMCTINLYREYFMRNRILTPNPNPPFIHYPNHYYPHSSLIIPIIITLYSHPSFYNLNHHYSHSSFYNSLSSSFFHSLSHLIPIFIFLFNLILFHFIQFLFIYSHFISFNHQFHSYFLFHSFNSSSIFIIYIQFIS
jgi:hypothetical protein